MDFEGVRAQPNPQSARSKGGDGGADLADKCQRRYCAARAKLAAGPLAARVIHSSDEDQPKRSREPDSNTPGDLSDPPARRPRGVAQRRHGYDKVMAGIDLDDDAWPPWPGSRATPRGGRSSALGDDPGRPPSDALLRRHRRACGGARCTRRHLITFSSDPYAILSAFM